MNVWVNGSINSALLMLKRKLSREGVFGKLSERARFVKPGDKRRHKRQRAERRGERTERRRQVSLAVNLGEISLHAELGQDWERLKRELTGAHGEFLGQANQQSERRHSFAHFPNRRCGRP